MKKKTNKKKQKSRKKTKLLLIPLIIISIVLISYVYINSQVINYDTKFLGTNLGYTKYVELDSKLESILKDKKVTLKNEDTTQEFSLEELGYTLKDDYKNELAQSDSIFGFNNKNSDITDDVLKIDEDKLSKSINKLNKDSKIQAADAYLTYENNEYVIKDEVVSDSINIKLASEKFVKNYTPETNEIDLSSAKKTPSIKSEDLVDEKENINNFINGKVVVKFDDEDYTLSKDELVNLVKIKEDSTFTIDEDKADEYFTSLTYDYDNVTYTATKRTEEIFYARDMATTFKDEVDANNTDITLEMDVEKEETTLTQKKQGAKKTYIEVNISSQHMWYYKDGELVLDSPVVTGTVSKGLDTPTGTFTITEKLEDKTLDGASVGFDYSIPVDYWMRLTNGGVGFHDGTWNTETDFGSDKYLTNGSHGCINLPLDIASELYSNADVGTTVYITA